MTPLAELHCHIEGAADPALVRRTAERHGIAVDHLFDGDGRYRRGDFSAFLAAYDEAASVFRTPEDYEALAYDHYSRLAGQGAIYGEIFISPDHAAFAGLTYADYLSGLAAGLERAHAETGIEGRFIALIVRNLGPERGRETAELIVSTPHPLVTGFGMAGDERLHHPRDFAAAFTTAADSGLQCTVHAGEFAGPESVSGALDHLPVERIGHGVRAIEAPELVRRLADEGIVLEVCPRSNVWLGVYPSLDAHPLPRLLEAGVPVTLNSDDPPFFHTSLSEDYAAAREMGLSEAVLAAATRTAIEAAFVDDATRRSLLAKLEATEPSS